MSFNIISQPAALSFVGNLPDIIIGSDDPIDVTIELGDDTLLEESYFPDNEQRVRIPIELLLDDYLKIVLPNTDLFEQAQGYGAVTISLDDGVNQDTLEFTVIKGGVNRKDFDTLTFVKENLLTWQPQVQSIKAPDLLWLSCYAPQSALIKVKAFFQGGTDETITLQTIDDPGLFTFNVNFPFIRGYFIDQPIYYDVWMESQAQSEGEPEFSTFRQRFVLSVDEHEYDDLFIFENTLGGIDTIRFTGEKKLINANNFDLGLFYDRSSEEYQVNPDKAFEKNTGYYRNKVALAWSQDFFSSKQKYIYELGVLNRILARDPELSDIKHRLAAFDFTYIFTEQKTYLDLRREEDLSHNLVIIGPEDEQYFLVPRLFQFPSLNDPTDALFPVQTSNNPQWQTLSFDTILNYILGQVGLPTGDRILETTITFTSATVASVYGKWIANGVQRETTQVLDFGAIPTTGNRRWDFVEFFPNGTIQLNQGVESTDPVKPIATSGALLAHEILWFDEGVAESTPSPEAGPFPNKRYRTNTALPGADRYAKIFEQSIQAGQSYHFILHYSEFSSSNYEDIPARAGMLSVSFKGGDANGTLSEDVSLTTHASGSMPGDFILRQITGGKVALFHKRNSMFGQLQFRLTFHYSTILVDSFYDTSIHFSLSAGTDYESQPYAAPIEEINGGVAEVSPVYIHTRSDLEDDYELEQTVLRRGEIAIVYDEDSGLPIGLKVGHIDGATTWDDLPYFYFPGALRGLIEEWSEVETYEFGEFVSYAGNIYMAVDTSLDIQPSSDPLKWELSSVGEFMLTGPIPLDRLSQSGATDGQALVWSASNGRWEPGSAGGSKWTEVASGIYRESSVGINITTLASNETLAVKSTVATGHAKIFKILANNDAEVFTVSSGGSWVQDRVMFYRSVAIISNTGTGAPLVVQTPGPFSKNFIGYSSTGIETFTLMGDGAVKARGITSTVNRSTFESSGSSGYGLGVVDVKSTNANPTTFQTTSIFRCMRYDNQVVFNVTGSYILMPVLSTSDPLIAGALWDDNGVIKRSAG